MSIIILIPALVCSIALCLRTPAKVFRKVALPVLLLCPMIYYLKVPLLPPIDFSDAVLLPLGIAMAIRSMPRWRFSVMDLWLLLFILSTGWADRKLGHQTASTFQLFDAVCTTLVPYMAGKLLIEAEGARIATLRRIVTLLFVVSIAACYERFFAVNLWERAFSPAFPGPLFVWMRQFRAGYARITGPFWQAEFAGTMLVIGILLAIWLGKYGGWEGRFQHARWLPISKWAVIAVGLTVALFFTQSRGPELGLLFGLPVVLIGRSRRPLRATLLVVLLLSVGGTASYSYIRNYSATAAPISEEQQTAAYRAVMLKNYVPMAENSGAWGLGLNFPRIGIQQSIDNEYLWVTLTQGWIGLATFLLLSLGTVYHLAWAAIYNPEKHDRAFAFALLGVFLGSLLILATVYLGLQPRIFFFLLAGWAQTLRAPREEEHVAAFEHVYT